MAQFLARFPSKRRNAIRRELRAPAEQGIAIRTVRGDELRLDPGGWADDCYQLHRASTDQMAWGMRWVNHAFYQLVLSRMANTICPAREWFHRHSCPPGQSQSSSCPLQSSVSGVHLACSQPLSARSSLS